jgi:hypothetical protein
MLVQRHGMDEAHLALDVGCDHGQRLSEHVLRVGRENMPACAEAVECAMCIVTCSVDLHAHQHHLSLMRHVHSQRDPSPHACRPSHPHTRLHTQIAAPQAPTYTRARAHTPAVAAAPEWPHALRTRDASPRTAACPPPPVAHRRRQSGQAAPSAHTDYRCSRWKALAAAAWRESRPCMRAHAHVGEYRLGAEQHGTSHGLMTRVLQAAMVPPHAETQTPTLAVQKVRTLLSTVLTMLIAAKLVGAGLATASPFGAHKEARKRARGAVWVAPHEHKAGYAPRRRLAGAAQAAREPHQAAHDTHERGSRRRQLCMLSHCTRVPSARGPFALLCATAHTSDPRAALRMRASAQLALCAPGIVWRAAVR